MVALCLGTAVLVALSVLRPGPQRGQQVLVASHAISAGAILTDRDVAISTLPAGALPQSPLTSTDQAVGSRTAISLEKGTVLTASMTSGSLAQQLGDDERLVQVAIDVGAELARPGARVDIIGQAPEGWTPPGQDDASQGGTTQSPGEQSESPTAPKDPGNTSTTSPTGSPDAPSSPTDQESPGFQESSLSISQGIPVAPFGTHSTVLCSGARVVMIQQVGEGGQWTGNKKVTLITLAIPASSATLVVGAATNSTLGIALSP
ncbi:SAF domain-containing protein [Actinomyces oris]|uniref:SAF domain-containing protein n=1 Tax=Actinomyces oris TaxID=544580 RepID=UPI002852B440|nr:SAF domain-containing protein [Actinomyces oris]